MTRYRDAQEKALRQARGEEPMPQKPASARTVLVQDGQLTPPDRKPAAEDPPPAGVSASRGPGRGLPWLGNVKPLSCADCRGRVTEGHAGTAPERACLPCGWRYRWDSRQLTWALVEG